MAEIDLSQIWSRSKEVSAHDQIDIDQAIRGRSRDTLRWIKIILIIELSLNVVLTPIIYFWWKSQGITWQFFPFLGVVLIYIGYYLFLIKAVSSFSYAEEVKAGLNKIYRYLKIYLLHYKVVIWVFYPLSYLYGLHLGLQENETPLSEFSALRWLKLIGISIAFNAAIIAFFTWLINLIYGRKIKRLKAILDSLEDES